MYTIDENFVRRVDDQLMSEDVKLHARPFHVAMQWMRERKIAGDMFDKRIWDPLMEAYRRLYPSGDFSMPALLVGGVALRDAMYPVRVSVGYGKFGVDPLKCIEITQEELELIFRHYPEQGWRAFYSVCDFLDFGYGVADLLRIGSPAGDLLNNARSSVVATPRILSGAIDIDAAVQTACLTAELSMKAALTHLGWKDQQLKSLSHHLTKLADALVASQPIASDRRLRAACTKFPNYIESRYSSHGLTRLELMALAMRAQFVAADAIRRVSERNIAGDMEDRLDCPPRPEP
jgi:hypothetical protein